MGDDPEQLKQQARASEPARRVAVAGHAAAPPELLYFLTTDRDETVRATAAENPGTPFQTIAVLEGDESRLVRAGLGRKLTRILPNLTGDTHRTALDTLGALCRDVAAEVRTAIATTLQDQAFLPPDLARLLAGDAERSVAGPVLRFCLSLTDDDLAQLIKTAKSEWVPVEIAQRQNISTTLAAAIWNSGNAAAAEALLLNRHATVDEPVLDEATEAAAVEVRLQRPLVGRPELTPLQMNRLAEFVDGSLLETLAKRIELRPELSNISAVVRRRLDWAGDRKRNPDQLKRAQKMFAAKTLDDAAVTDAIAWNERDFVTAALSLRARVPLALAEKILAHQSPKGITALCFRAGISMRTCRLVQIRTARLHPFKALLARGGTDYPLTEAEIRWQWEFYGIVQQAK